MALRAGVCGGRAHPTALAIEALGTATHALPTIAVEWPHGHGCAAACNRVLCSLATSGLLLSAGVDVVYVLV